MMSSLVGGFKGLRHTGGRVKAGGKGDRKRERRRSDILRGDEGDTHTHTHTHTHTGERV